MCYFIQKKTHLQLPGKFSGIEIEEEQKKRKLCDKKESTEFEC